MLVDRYEYCVSHAVSRCGVKKKRRKNSLFFCIACVGVFAT